LLIGIFCLIRVLNNIDKITAFNMQYHLLKTDTALGLEYFIFLVIPSIIHKHI